MVYLPHLMTNYTPVFRPKPVPDLETAHDEPQICVKFSAALVPYLLGLLEIYRWEDRFRGDEADRKRGVAIFAELMCILQETDMCCCDETNELLRQLLTAQRTAANSTNAQIALTLQQLDDGTPQSFAPNAPVMWDGNYEEGEFSNADYDAALCQAVKDMMGTALTQAGNAIGFAGAITAGIIGAIGFFVPVAAPVTSIIGFITGLTTIAFQAMLDDAEAIRKVVCCVLRGLHGRELNRVNLAFALANSNCEWENANQSLIAEVFSKATMNEDTYRAFTRHYTSLLSTGSGDTTCECCEDGPILRLDYRFQGYAGETEPLHPVRESMSWSGNVLTITPYRTQGDGAWVNEYEFGFRLETVGDCCVRARLLTPVTLLCGSGAAYDGGANVPGGFSQRDGGYECLGFVDCGAGNPIDDWFCFSALRFRLWTNYGAGYPAWFDTGIQIEFDFDYVC